jgi:hypothetical protein
MQAQLLIDDIVRQTTVLIAQLSTAAGLRAPLSQIADQVFLQLSRELAAQGVRQKVAADMFGMALRSYQMKVRRLSDPGIDQPTTLWQGIHHRLFQGSATREELEAHFKGHPAKDVAAALQDMVQSGIAYASGRGAVSVYGLTSPTDRARLTSAAGAHTCVDMAWYLVASGAASTRDELARELRCDVADLSVTLQALLDEGSLQEKAGRLSAKRFEIAVGAERGWETAVCDHFRAVAAAIAAKVGRASSEQDDRTGGGTVSFVLPPGHPHAEEAHCLLRNVRDQVNALWRRAALHNEAHPPPEGCDRLTFYFGQHLVVGEAVPSSAASSQDGLPGDAADSEDQ